jgi:hypothetical protein
MQYQLQKFGLAVPPLAYGKRLFDSKAKGFGREIEWSGE